VIGLTQGLLVAVLVAGGDPAVAPGIDVFEVSTSANLEAAPEVLAQRQSVADAGGAVVDERIPTCLEARVVPCIPVEVCEADAGSDGEFTTRMHTATEVYWVAASCSPPDVELEARPSLPALVLRAFERVPLPEPRLSIQPPKGRTLVGLETIFSTQAEPFTRTLTLLGRQVELRITPSRFHWLHDDSTTQTTDWPGKPWDSDQPDIDGYVTHLYEHTGTVRPGVEVTWSAQYRVGNGPWQDVDGTVTRTSPRAELQVLEGEPVLHGY
jgi:hypothetical protein